MRAWSSLVVALMAMALFAGCISDTPTAKDPGSGEDVGLPAYTLPETITGMEPVQQLEFTLADGTVVDRVSATGIWFHDNILYTSGRPGMGIVDITDPEAPVAIAMLDEETVSRDVDIMEHPNGYLYAVLAGTHDEHGGVVLVNVTDPENAEVVSVAKVGIHNIAVVPGTALVYNSRSVYREADVATEGGLVDIIDFTDPANPVIDAFRFGHSVTTVDGKVKTPKAPACHDISVYVDVGRAYCAGVTETQVWDISDPAKPVILQIVDNPGTNIHHAAYAARNHSILIIGDELGGAAFAPGCTISDQPYGGVWFVDISDLAMPMPLGWWAPKEAHEEPVWVRPPSDPTKPGIPAGASTCTAHFGNLIEDRDLLVMGFYTAGVFIIDFSDATDPVEVANYRPGGNVWEGRYHRGFIYTGDGARGVDILRPTGEGEVVLS